MFHTLAKWLGLADSRPTRVPDVSREWREYLRRYVWQYEHLGTDHRYRLEDVVAHMMAERRWSGGNGFEITEEMCVAVSGLVALMTLGLDEPYYFPRVPEIILYPRGFFATADQSALWNRHPVLGTEVNQPRLGEAWFRGPIILAWDRIAEPYDAAGNLVNVAIHEFTHHLDGLDGNVEGTPPLDDEQLERDWYRVTELDFLELVGQARRGEQHLLSHYGATNRAEFFAVASECFFDRPHDLRDEHPHLYEVMSKFFRQSPADYLPREAMPPLRHPRTAQRRRRVVRQPLPSDPYLRGLQEFNSGNFQAAVQAYSIALSMSGEDAELYASRGLAQLMLEKNAEALQDAQRALELDPDDRDAQLVQGCALVRRGEYAPAILVLQQVCRTMDTSLGHAHLGYAYQQENDLKRGLHHLNVARALDPYRAETYRWRAALYRQLGQPDDAASDDDKAARLDPS